MITPVLLCGGSGTRLWPLSRKSFPKQFADVIGAKSLFQASALRFRGLGFEDPVVVTDNSFRFIVTEQLAELGITPAGILIEPEGRNTAPASIAATLFAAKSAPDTLVLLVPSDHAVADPEAFRAAIKLGTAEAKNGQLVTFGISPNRAETGYGWLKAGTEIAPGVMKLNSFIEKPDAARATELLADKSNLWNAGVFLASAKTLISAFREHAPDIFNPVNAALEDAKEDLNFTRIDPNPWSKVPEDSIDYAVMEKANNVSVVRFDGQWSDLGSWEAVWQESAKDNAGNALSERATALNCKDSLLRSENSEVELVGIGLKNMVAVATRDAVLVADMSDTQNVKKAVKVLRDRGAKQAEHFPVDHRPWGWFETLVLANRFQVKRIHVHPGASLSLQRHHRRSEHWIVVEGTAKITIEGETRLLMENQSTYVPLGAVHRVENPGKQPMVMIEVQTGSYLGEDDIIRYEDIYARESP